MGNVDILPPDETVIYLLSILDIEKRGRDNYFFESAIQGPDFNPLKALIVNYLNTDWYHAFVNSYDDQAYVYDKDNAPLDCTIRKPVYMVFLSIVGNWWFREDGFGPMYPAINPPNGPAGYGTHFGDVTNIAGAGNKIRAYQIETRQRPDGEPPLAVKFNIDVSVYQADYAGIADGHETKLIIDPVLKNEG